MNQSTMTKIIRKINELPVLPQVTNRIIELINDPKTTTIQICEVLGQDQVIVSKALKIVNSAYYGLPRKVATIKEAVTLLGIETLKTLVIGASVYNTIEGLSEGRKINIEALCRHSAACAAASRIIAIRLGVNEKEHAFVAGLLHDIGKTILAFVMPKEYYDAVNTAAEGECPIEAEKRILGVSHTEVGKIAAEKWNLPPFLVQIIGTHHDNIYEEQNCELLTVVQMANSVSHMAGYSTITTNNVSINTRLLEHYGLAYDDLCLISDELKGKISIDFL